MVTGTGKSRRGFSPMLRDNRSICDLLLARGADARGSLPIEDGEKAGAFAIAWTKMSDDSIKNMSDDQTTSTLHTLVSKSKSKSVPFLSRTMAGDWKYRRILLACLVLLPCPGSLLVTRPWSAVSCMHKADYFLRSNESNINQCSETPSNVANLCRLAKGDHGAGVPLSH